MNVRSNQSIEDQLSRRIRELELEKEQLEETVQELQQHFIQSRFPVIAVNEQRKITFVNEATCHFLQMNDDALIGKNLFELIQPRQDFFHFQTGTDSDSTLIMDITLPDGTVKHIELQKLGTKKCGLLYVIHEKNQEKFPAREMNLTESIFQNIFQHFQDSLLLLDQNGTIIYANPIFCDIFAISTKKCTGKSLACFFPEKKKEEYALLLHRIRENGEPFSGIFSLQKDSNCKIFDASIYYNDADRMFVLILRDRTELMNMYNLMNVTLQRIHTTFDNMIDGMIIWSKQNIPLQFTSYFERIFQQQILYEENELKIFLINRMGKNILALNPERPLYEQLQQLTIHDKNEAFPFPVYLQRLQQKCGPYIVHLQTGDNRTVGIELYHLPNIVSGLNLTVFRDITERLAMEDNLRKSEMFHVLGELAAGVAHEIRNPMTSLKGFIQLLEASVEGYTMYFKIILSELDRIESIVNEFLVLAKPQAIQYQYYNVIKIMKDTIDLLSAQAALENVRIHTFFSEETMNIFCEPNQIKQVFINIVKNAIEVMAGGGNIMIRISQEPDTPFVKVSIRDEGEGIPEERLEKLGQPFYTSKERGTGLGLMVSYKIVKEHGGKIVVDSKVGQGTVFHIYLPTQELDQEG